MENNVNFILREFEVKRGRYNIKKNSCKFLLVLILGTVVFSLKSVKAYESPNTYNIINYHILNDYWSETGWVTKNKWGPQAYENTFSSTSLTNPCINCQILTKLKGNGFLLEGIVTKMGIKKDFSKTDMSGSPEDYRLMMTRADHTLLSTIHSAIWFINK